jgi:hypothetical protein
VHAGVRLSLRGCWRFFGSADIPQRISDCDFDCDVTVSRLIDSRFRFAAIAAGFFSLLCSGETINRGRNGDRP